MMRIRAGVSVVAALGVALAFVAHTQLRSAFDVPPSSMDPSQWDWVGTAPGMNVYVSHRSTRQSDGSVSTWVDRRYSSNVAGIDTNVTELKQFDCRGNASRRLASANRYHDLNGGQQTAVSRATSQWTIVRPGSTDELILLAACQHSPGREANEIR
jgi:hypothetical protein